MIKKFGKLPTVGETHLYMIHSGSCLATFCDLGATWVGFQMPDRDGRMSDVVLGFGTPREYYTNKVFMGAVVGRNANRIGGASFPMGQETVQLNANEGGNNLHSGPNHWHLRHWAVESHFSNAITFLLHSPDGDQGFPGAGDIRVTYALNGGSLSVTYEATFDKDTVFNPTQHVYFNLAGQEMTDYIPAQFLTIAASHYTPVDGEGIPTGEILPVAGTVLDYTRTKRVGRNLADEPLLRAQKGLDHNFVLDRPGMDTPAAKLTSSFSGRTLTVYTDCPGIQVYVPNRLGISGKKRIYYGKAPGICLETQFFPNSVNVPHWPQCTVKAGQRVTRRTKFAFAVENA